MTSSPGTRFHALDGLRMVGALAVLTTHVGFESGDALRGPLAGLLSRLDAGVALFFVVSGFLLFRPHAVAHLEGRHRPRVKPYLVRRAARILPVLWIAVAASALLLTPRRPSGDYIAHAFLVQIYLGTPLTAGLTQMWSLATEVAFYILLPALAWVLCRGSSGRGWFRRTLFLLGLAVGFGPLWTGVATHLNMPQARLWLPAYVGWFAVGMALATWNAGRRTGVVRPGKLDVLGRYPGTLWALGGALFLMASTPIAGPLDLTEPTPGQAATKCLLYTAIGLLAVMPTVLTVGQTLEPSSVRVLSSRTGVALGQISYGVFAYHVVILALVSRLPGLEPFTGGFAIRWVITVGAALGVAWLSYVAVERPVMRWARRRGASARSAKPMATRTPANASPTSP